MSGKITLRVLEEMKWSFILSFAFNFNYYLELSFGVELREFLVGKKKKQMIMQGGLENLALGKSVLILI